MPLNSDAEKEFINDLTDALLKKVPNPSAEVTAGMKEWSTTMCTQIVKLIKNTSITNPDGSVSLLKLK